MIGKTIYRFESGDNGLSILTKVTHVSLDEVRLSQDVDGEVTITPRSPAQVQARKYELVPEGGLYRLVALRDLGGVPAGTRGGLVASSSNLSDKGDCWIYENAQVTGSARVHGHAQVYDSILSGSINIHGEAVVVDVSVSGDGHTIICGNTNLRNVEIDCHGYLEMRGNTEISDSKINVDYNTSFSISGCCITDADIANEYELLSFGTKWGFMSAYRDMRGELTFSVGCQRHGDFDAMRDMARSMGVTETQMGMLEGFFQMVEAARPQWRPAAVSGPGGTELVEGHQF